MLFICCHTDINKCLFVISLIVSDDTTEEVEPKEFFQILFAPWAVAFVLFGTLVDLLFVCSGILQNGLLWTSSLWLSLWFSARVLYFLVTHTILVSVVWLAIGFRTLAMTRESNAADKRDFNIAFMWAASISDILPRQFLKRGALSWNEQKVYC